MELNEIGTGFYHFRSGEELFHRNIFIKRFAAGGNQAFILFDPGAKTDAANLNDACDRLTGGVASVDLVFVSHQDPDVASNVKFVLDHAPAAYAIASVDSWRLIKMTGIPDNRFYFISGDESEKLRVEKTGHIIEPVIAPYCHFRGSCMLYDPESGVLFSGDLFGGVNSRKGKGIYANDKSWEGIALFHQLYMPSSKAIRDAVRRIRALQPAVTVIAPQHGDVIAGAWVAEFLDQMEELEVGVDLSDKHQPAAAMVVAALNDFLGTLARDYVGVYAKIQRSASHPRDFTTAFSFQGERIVRLKVEPTTAVTHFWNLLESAAAPAERDRVKLQLAVSLESSGIPVPSYCLSMSGIPTKVLDLVRGG